LYAVDSAHHSLIYLHAQKWLSEVNISNVGFFSRVRENLISTACIIPTKSMARKYQKEAAAHARAGRAAARLEASLFESDNVASRTPSETPGEHQEGPTFVDLACESESDCNYSGGVNNFDWEESDYKPGMDLGEEQSDCDAESLSGFEGDSVEANLEELRAELDLLNAPSKYAQITERKSGKEWRKAEKNRALGYMGTSQRTQQRKAKEARERAAFRKEAQTS
jgi:hypothetical protein